MYLSFCKNIARILPASSVEKSVSLVLFKWVCLQPKWIQKKQEYIEKKIVKQKLLYLRQIWIIRYSELLVLFYNQCYGTIWYEPP